MEIMEKKRSPKTHKPVVLRINSIDYDKINESKDFKDYIYNNTIKAIQFAINNNKKKVNTFQIGGIDTFVSLTKDKFAPVLDTMIKFYESQSKFEKCTELVKLKEKC